MTDDSYALHELVAQDDMYSIEAYFFVRDALGFASDSLELEKNFQHGNELIETNEEHHLSGQQLCQAIREYALGQFGYMTRIVLKNWGVHTTSDFGNIVYNMIEIGLMKKSPNDQRSHFDNVYDFKDVFDSQFQISGSSATGRV